MERNMRDLQAALDKRQLHSLNKEVPIALDVELMTHQLNHRRLRSLGGLTPCQVFHDQSRQRIFREVFTEFWQYIENIPDRNRHTTAAAWRLVVETWLRRQAWISVKEKPQTHKNVSTISNPFYSQN
jgi:hypothetical protein